MKASPLAQTIALAGVGACLTLPNLAHADFIADSKASLELRNFYMNRDYRQDGSPALPKVTGKTPVEYRSKSEEWAQGFLMRYESGFNRRHSWRGPGHHRHSGREAGLRSRHQWHRPIAS